MINNDNINKLPPEMQSLNSLKKQTLQLLADVNYMLTEAGQIDEAIIVIGLPNSGKTSVLNALALNEKHEKVNLDYKLNTCLPQKFKIGNKVFWEYSNKLSQSDVNQQELLVQTIINSFFIEGLKKISNKFKFIMVVKKEAVTAPNDSSFTSIEEYFESVFPSTERQKLQNNVICVVTQLNQKDQEQFLKLLEQKQRVLGFFPKLLTNLKYLYNSEVQNDNPVLTLKLEDISNTPETKVSINTLNSFPRVKKDNLGLIKALYDEIQENILEIYNVIESVFDKKNFNIYKPFNDLIFLDKNYKKYVEKFFSQSELNYPPLKQDFSNFSGLQQLSKLKAALDGWDNNGDPLSIGLEILGIIKEFASDIKIYDYYYILDQQIKELLLFQEALPTVVLPQSYKEIINSCKLFIEENYLSAIENIQPKDNECIGYYTEAIKWLCKHSNPKKVDKTKSICYDKMGDVYNEMENYEAALANYNYAFKYNEDARKIYNKMAYTLIKLHKYELAIEYYENSNLLTETLGCFDILIKNAPLEEKATHLSNKANYLFSKKLFQDSVYTNLLLLGFTPTDKKFEMVCRIRNCVLEALDNEIEIEYNNFETKLKEENSEYITQIIGAYPEI